MKARLAGIRGTSWILFVSLMMTTWAPGQAQPAKPEGGIEGDSLLCDRYRKCEYQIPMRDGVKLFTTAYIPKDSTTTAPIMLTRTPYGVGPYGPDKFISSLGNQRLKYASAGYILVYQDVRGTHMSEGTFVNVRPYIPDKKSLKDIDETSDTYDTVEWLIRNLCHNNGRVGVSGVSYPGFYSSMAAIDAHPAIKAVSPQAPVSRWMGGDDFFHNGALLLPHAFNFFATFGKPRSGPTTTGPAPFNHGTNDEYRFFLEMGPLPNANAKYLKDSIAFWNEIIEHGKWDAFWEARDVLKRLRGIKPAMMFVGGWFDTENLWGALNGYAETEKNNSGIANILVMGPWSHGQWTNGDGSSLGDVAWGSKTARFYTDSIEFPFFEYHLMGRGKAPAFEAAVFETGTDQWRFLDLWPPADVDSTRIYLQQGHRLSFKPPATSASPFDEYVNDPDKPVPYTEEIRRWYNPAFMVADQRFAWSRPDVLSYETEALSDQVTIAGPVEVRLFVSTSGTDCDWVVKVIDRFPDDAPLLAGRQMLVRGDVMRGKFRESPSSPRPLVPGEVTELSFKLQDLFHAFKKGHRIMIQIQSSWFPMIDRNPGKCVDIFRAKESDFQKTTQRVYHDAAHPSCIVVLKRRSL